MQRWLGEDGARVLKDEYEVTKVDIDTWRERVAALISNYKQPENGPVLYIARAVEEKEAL